MPDFRQLPITQVIEPVHPARFAMDDGKLRELADSIKANGIFQPLIVISARESGSGAKPESGADTPPAQDAPLPLYEIVAGHRRYKAAVMVGLTTLPCMVYTTEEIGLDAVRLEENCRREDVTDAELAAYYSELIQLHDFTEEQLSKHVRQSPAFIDRRLALYKGHEAVFHAVAARQIVLGVAELINRVDDPQHARYLLALAVDGGATIRVVSEWVKQYKEQGPGPVIAAEARLSPGPAPGTVTTGPECILCGRSNHPANIRWVPIHDYELERILESVATAAEIPGAEAPSPAASG